MNAANEVLGLAATAMMIVAFLMKGEKRIRQFDLIGAALFVAYGFAIRSLSTVVFNCVLCGIQVYNLRKLRKKISPDCSGE